MKFATEISGPIAVVGDLHGQVDKLGEILDAIQDAPDFERRWVVFAGDFVDRGPDTRACLEMVLEFMEYHPRTTGVTGNHDFAMAASLGLVPTPEYSNWAGRWLDHYNSDATFASYGVPFGDLQGLHDALPETHRQFLANLPWVVEHPEYLIVHAGLDSYSPYEMQLKILRQKDFSLNRPQWLCDKQFAEGDLPEGCTKTVVSGHVWMPKVVFRRNRILCDTTGGVEGNLSAVLLPEMNVLQSGPPQRSSAAVPAPQSSKIASRNPAPRGHRVPSPPEHKAWWKFW